MDNLFTKQTIPTAEDFEEGLSWSEDTSSLRMHIEDDEFEDVDDSGILGDLGL